MHSGSSQELLFNDSDDFNESRNRIFSYNSFDPNEDPVVGLERFTNNNNNNNTSGINIRRRELRRNDNNDRSQERVLHYSCQNTPALSEKYESLDYEIIENDLYRNEENEPNHQNKLFRLSVDRWIVSFLIGACTAFVAVFIDFIVYYNAKLKFQLIINPLVNLCEHQSIGNSGCMWIVLTTWSIYNCILVLSASALVLYVAPVATGSGIPLVKCFLNGIRIPGVVRFKTLFVKAVGVAFAVGGGLAVGKEGPMIHSGAAVAAGISQGRSHTFPINLHIFKYFRNDREKRDFVSAGAAAGISAAFAAPIGGVLYSLEEGASFWNQGMTWRMVFTAMISTFTLNCILSLFYEEGGQLAWNGLANFGVFESTNNYSVYELPFFMLIGVIGGLSGSFFNMLSVKLTRFRKRYIKTNQQKLFECFLVASASAFFGFITLIFVEDCQPIGVNPKLTVVTKLWCPKGEYSAVANLFFQNPEESIKSLFHSPKNSFRPFTLIIFAIEYFILTVWTAGISVPSGMFIPNLLIGAAWGRLFGVGVEYFFPNLVDIDPGKYAVVGAAAQLGGIVRMTIALTAIIVETTKNISFGLPVMIILMITKWIGDIFNEGVYDSYIDLAEIPVLDWHPPKLARNICAKTIMRKDVVALEPIENVGRIVEILLNTRHHGFPVVDRIGDPLTNRNYPDYGHLKGLILRSQLMVLLEKKYFSMDYNSSNLNLKQLKIEEFQENYPRYDFSLKNIHLSVEEEKYWINLSPFMHSSPFRVPLTSSLESIFTLFKGLGLRFLFVVNDENKLRGIITRKDIARFKERRVKNKYLVHEVYISNYSN